MKSENTFTRSARRGMAILVVLSFTTILMILGVTYLKSFSQSTVTSKLQLETVQSEFFARGVQNIALFKVKRYPDFLFRSYRYKVYHDRLAAGEALEAPVVPVQTPAPFAKFTGVFTGQDRDILNNIPDGENAMLRFTEPLRIATYSTQFSLMSADDFKRAFVEISVSVQLEGKNLVNTYRKSLDASQTARL